MLKAGLKTRLYTSMPRSAPHSRLAHHFAASVLLFATVVGASSQLSRAADRAEVFVLGTLYKRHDAVPAYDLPALRRIIVAIQPEVLVLDCTPREIAEQRVHASKVEYPGVVFPLMREGRYKVYPAEPDEPMFSEIVQSIIAANTALEKERPDAAAAVKSYRESTYAALATRWRSPADVHDEVTAAALAAKEALDAEIVGPVLAKGGERWNRHWADAIVKAAAENPGRRILALAGIENRAPIAKALEGHANMRVVDIAAWLRGHP
jgi:hypothetical protein